QHLVRGFRARLASQHDGYIAELALEGTAARELDRDVQIIMDLEQVEPRNRSLSDIRFILVRVYALISAASEVFDERLPGDLSFIQDHDIAVTFALFRRRRRVGPAENHELSCVL